MEKLLFEILKVRLRRAAESLKDDASPAGASSREKEMLELYRHAEKWIRRSEDAQSELEQAQKQLAEISALQHKIRHTWRWRIGNWVVEVANALLFRKKSHSTAFDRLDLLLEGIRDSLEGSGKPFDPYRFASFGDQLAGPVTFPPPGKVAKGKVAYIVLNRNGAEHLEKLFSSFLKFNTYQDYEFLVVDHHSDDQSGKVIDDYCKRLNIKLFSFPLNYTFSYSNNFAACQTDAEFLFILNNDIIFDQDVTGKLLEVFSKFPDAGIVSPVLYYPDDQFMRSGSVQHAGIRFAYKHKREDHISLVPTDPPSFRVLEYRYSHLFRDAILPFNIQEVPAGLAEVPAICAAAMVCRREDFLLAGGFDENYIYGYEDVDLSLVFLKKLKRKLLIVNDLGMIHNESFTRKKEGLYKASLKIHNMLVLQYRFGYYLKVNYLRDHYSGIGFWGMKMSPDQVLQKPQGDLLNIAVKWPAEASDTTQVTNGTPFPGLPGSNLTSHDFQIRTDPPGHWYEQGIMTDDIVISFPGEPFYYPQPGQINVLWLIPGRKLAEPAVLRFYDLVVLEDEAMRQETEEWQQNFNGKIISAGSVREEFLAIHHDKAGL